MEDKNLKFKELKKTKAQIESFCRAHNIKKFGHEFHFVLNDKEYILGPHVVVLTVKENKAYVYYEIDSRQHNITYIKAPQRKLIDIYTAISEGRPYEGL